MALVLKDRVKETTTTTGTGSFALAGAVTGYDSFGQIGNGNTTYYAVYLDGGSEWEVGIGTYTAPSTLSRDTILASSNAGNIVTFSAGQKTIWCDYPAGKAVYLDASGSISEPIVNISGITGAISTVDTMTFDTGYTTPLTAGQLGWDGNNTLGIGMAGGNVIQHIGEDQFFYCKATSAITKGQVVMFTGAVGASGVPTGAPATGITDGSYIMGIAAENIANNGFGLVQSFGTLRNVNTSGYADGDILWYDPAVTGGLTKTKPVAPNVKVQMAAVINGGSSGGGTILIRINAGSTLGGTDSNAQITSPTGGQTLIYDQTDGYWKNATLTDGTAISITEGASGTITITNTAPDQTVVLNGAGTTTVTGTYPNFTITSNDQYVGTVTSVAALSLGTTGTDLNSTVANSTTTPVITLNVPTASATNRGALSAADWTTFNNKANAFTYTTNYIPYGQGTTTPTQSVNLQFNGTTLTSTNFSTDGNLTFTSTSNRITGDFSNATLANRVMFQNSVTNGRTNISALPNGTSTSAGVDLYGSSSDTANTSLFRIANTNAEYQLEGTRTGTGSFLPLTIYTSGSERMRITSGGDLLVGTTSASGRLTVVAGSDEAVWSRNSNAGIATMLAWNDVGSGDNVFHQFYTDAGATLRGSIDYNRAGGLVRYNTTSDATLKNIFGDADGQKSVDILKSTRIREYAWKDDAEQKPQIGVIAQELYETYKGAVSVGGEDKKGDYKPWSVDKTAFTFHLIAGWQAHEKLIQEQQAMIEELKQEVALFKSK